MPLRGLTLSQQQILDHWTEFQLQMVQELEASNQLETVLKSVDNLATSAYADCIQAGMSVDQAEETTRPMWMSPSQALPDLPGSDNSDPPTAAPD